MAKELIDILTRAGEARDETGATKIRHLEAE